jgi:hypothetical protein
MNHKDSVLEQKNQICRAMFIEESIQLPINSKNWIILSSAFSELTYFVLSPDVNPNKIPERKTLECIAILHGLMYQIGQDISNGKTSIEIEYDMAEIYLDSITTLRKWYYVTNGGPFQWTMDDTGEYRLKKFFRSLSKKCEKVRQQTNKKLSIN